MASTRPRRATPFRALWAHHNAGSQDDLDKVASGIPEVRFDRLALRDAKLMARKTREQRCLKVSSSLRVAAGIFTRHNCCAGQGQTPQMGQERPLTWTQLVQANQDLFITGLFRGCFMHTFTLLELRARQGQLQPRWTQYSNGSLGRPLWTLPTHLPWRLDAPKQPTAKYTRLGTPAASVDP